MSANVINVILEPERGRVDKQSLEVTVGAAMPRLPGAERHGWVFDGWYTEKSGGQKICSGDIVTQDTDFTLWAHWKRPATETAAAAQQPEATKKTKSLLRTQRIAILALLCVVLVLAVSIPLIRKFIVNVYHFEDVDGTNYTVKAVDGKYVLFTPDGEAMTAYTYSYDDDPNTVYKKTGQGKITYFIAASGNQIQVDPETGDAAYFAVVDTDEGEMVYSDNVSVMMYPQIMQTNVHSLEVHNEHGTYRFTTWRAADGTNQVNFEGFENVTGLSYDGTAYAGVCAAADQSWSTLRMTWDAVVSKYGYEEYGFNVLYNEDGSICDVSSQNYFVITERYYNEKTATYESGVAGLSYRVYIGDSTPDGSGYYVKLAGRDTLYVLYASKISYLLQPVTSLLDAHICYPLGTSDYYSVENFKLYKISYTTDENGETVISDTDINVAFSYIPLEERANTLATSETFTFIEPYTYKYDDYAIESDAAINALMQICYLEADEIMAVHSENNDEEFEAALKQYGLDNPEYLLTFTYLQGDGYGNNVEIPSTIIISKKNGTQYYAYSPFAEMILAVSEQHLLFLEYDETDWVTNSYMSENITYVSSFSLATKDKTVTFDLNNNWSMPIYFTESGTQFQTQDYTSIKTNADGTMSAVYYMYEWKTGREGTGMYRSSYNVSLDADENVTGYTSNNDETLVSPSETLTEYVTRHATLATTDSQGRMDNSWAYLNYRVGLGAKISETVYNQICLYENLIMYWDINDEMLGYDKSTGKLYSGEYSFNTEYLRVECSDTTGKSRVLYPSVTYDLNGDGVKEELSSTNNAGTSNLKDLRYLYQEILANIMEDTDLSEEEMAELRDKDDAECLLVMTFTMDDNASLVNPYADEDNHRVLVYRFYQYSDRRCYLTINGGGEYYVLSTFVKKIIADADRVLNGEVVDKTAKY